MGPLGAGSLDKGLKGFQIQSRLEGETEGVADDLGHVLHPLVDIPGRDHQGGAGGLGDGLRVGMLAGLFQQVGAWAPLRR